MTYAVLLAGLLGVLPGCSRESSESRFAPLVMSAPASTKAHWTDNSDGTAAFSWNTGSDMICAVAHSGAFVPFYSSLTDASASYASPAMVSAKDGDSSKADIQTVEGLYPSSTSAALRPVAVGDDVYFFEPVNAANGAVLSAGATEVSVSMHMPQTFEFNTPGALESLKDYSYIYSSTTLATVAEKQAVAQYCEFLPAAAILRFNLSNAMTEEISVSRIEVSVADDTPLFPDHLRWTAGVSPAICETADASGYYSSLQIATGGAGLPPSSPQAFYAYVLPLDDGRDYTGKSFVFTVQTNYLTYRMNLNASAITSAKFEAGKMYTFNLQLSEKEISISTIEVAECTCYNVSTSRATVVVTGSDASWYEVGDVAANMEFVGLGMEMDIQLPGDAAPYTYEVLWATSNLGAKEPMETGRLFSWGEVSVKKNENYSPAGYIGTATSDISGREGDPVLKNLGSGVWTWVMPTKAMWEALMDSSDYDWTWVPIKKVSDGGDENDNIDFDVSVWKIASKTKSNSCIFLPITGYMGELENTPATYGKNEVHKCCYWTSTPCSAIAGAEQLSYAIYSDYVIDGSYGYMNPPVVAQQKRYNGFAVRPVLLKRM